MKRISNGSNPHVLKMLGCVTTTLPMMLIMQFVPHGSLKEYLRAMKSNVDNVTNKVATFTALYSCTCHVCIYIHINIAPCIHTRHTQVHHPLLSEVYVLCNACMYRMKTPRLLEETQLLAWCKVHTLSPLQMKQLTLTHSSQSLHPFLTKLPVEWYVGLVR